MRSFWIFLLFFSQAFSRCPDCALPHYFQVDRFGSPTSASEDILSVYDLVIEADDFFMGRLMGKKGVATLLQRASEMAFFWVPVAQFLSATEHEVFGHGYRIRSIGEDKARVTNYALSPPIPYGSGDWCTRYKYSVKLTTTEQIAITGAGCESNFVLGATMKNHFFAQNAIDGRQTPLYAFTALDFLLYATLASGRPLAPWNDMVSYTNQLNAAYGPQTMTLDKLRAIASFNLADPYLFYSVMSGLYYLVVGQKMPIWTPCIFGTRFMPSMGSLPAPYGPELHLRLDLEHNGTLWNTHLRGGYTAGKGAFGISLRSPELFSWGILGFGARGEFWVQPGPILTPYVAVATNLIDPPLPQRATKPGVLGELYANLKLGSLLWLHLEIGYKSPGFVEGESLGAAPILRIGAGSCF